MDKPTKDDERPTPEDLKRRRVAAWHKSVRKAFGAKDPEEE